MSSEASRSTAATGKAYRALKELVRAALATLSAALATALNPNPAPAPAPDPYPGPNHLQDAAAIARHALESSAAAAETLLGLGEI